MVLCLRSVFIYYSVRFKYKQFCLCNNGVLSKLNGWKNGNSSRLSYLDGSVDLAKEEGQQSDNDEVDATSEIGKFVELKCSRNNEEYNLHHDRHNGTDRKVIVV